MKQLVLNIVRLLVEHPDDVRITSLTGASCSVMELRCHSDDLGKVIGKEGKTVGSIRTLLSAIAARQGRKAVLEVVE